MKSSKRSESSLHLELALRKLDMDSNQCPFCHLPHERILIQTEETMAFLDGYPISQGHMRVQNQSTNWRALPRRHAKKKPNGRRLRASFFWQKWELTSLGTAADKEVAQKVGRSKTAVFKM